MKKVQYLKIMAAAILGISGMFALQPGTLTMRTARICLFLRIAANI